MVDDFSFATILARVEGKVDTRWAVDKRRYLRGLEARAKLGALDGYVNEAMATNIFSSLGSAGSVFVPDLMADAIINQNFNAAWLRRMSHAATWTSYVPLTGGVLVYRYFVLRLHSTAKLTYEAAKLIYEEESDKIPTSEAAAADTPATPVT
jgi:hypothetical protein